MKAEPNNGVGFASNEDYQSNSPLMTYQVPFPQSETYYVWIRGMGGSPADDSVHAGLDDNEDGSADSGNALDMTGWHTDTWQWSRIRMNGQPAIIQVSGNPFHTLKLWMREDGMRVDKIILTTDSNYVPPD